MSYYRYITGVYKSYWPELNRTLRSSSVPRTVPDLDSSQYVRGTSMPPNTYFSDSHSPYVASCFYSSRRNVASPFADRALSVPPSTYTSGYSSSSSASSSHYSDFDCKASRAGSVATARLMLESALLHLSPSSSLSADVAAKALLDKHSLPACSLRLRGMAKEASQGTAAGTFGMKHVF